MAKRKHISPRRTPTIRMEGATKEYLEIARNRLVLATVLFVFGFMAVGGRVIDLAVFKRMNEPPASARASTHDPVAKGRADIVDRNGLIIATTLKTASLYADPKMILNAKEATEKLAKLFKDIPKSSIEEKLTSEKRFVWIKRHLTPREQFQVNALGIPGLNFQTDARRVYPMGNLFSHVSGYTDVDGQGISGVEKYFDNKLRTINEPFKISLDTKIQHTLRQELIAGITKHRAVGGAGVIMDAKNGEVLAMVSLPDFDPNNPTATPDIARFNRTSLGVYEMGSTFKIFNTAMALESGKVGLRNSYDVSEPIKIAGGFMIKDFKPEGKILTVPEIFVHSSNIGSAKMAIDAGTDVQKIFMKKIGMLEPASIELGEVGSPIWPKTWREVNTMTIAFGHGISVSPVQLVTGISAMVNGGILHHATILPTAANTTEGMRLISAETSDTIRKLMRQVVIRGTGTKAEASGYLVGGKTGSSEKVGSKGYEETSLISSFAGVFPINDPRYVVYVMVDEPKAAPDTYGYATGGWVAAPIVSKVVTRIAPILEIPPQNESSTRLQQATQLDITPKLSGDHQLVSYP